jgi:hypothetical protein
MGVFFGDCLAGRSPHDGGMSVYFNEVTVRYSEKVAIFSFPSLVCNNKNNNNYHN